MPIEIIGAGFGRTGTRTLQLALEQLGYRQCYHMVSLFHRTSDVKYWEHAAARKPVNWEELFEGYRATVDFPGSLYYKELMAKYPDAKIILTVRDPEKWYISTHKTIFSFNPGWKTKLKLFLTMFFDSRSRELVRIIKMNKKTIWGKLFQNRFQDQEIARKIFLDHINEVKSYVPGEKLLVFNVSEGWEPLCNFLGKPVPAAAFPYENRKEDFHIMTKKIIDGSIQ